MSRRRVLFVATVFPRWEDDATPPFVLNLGEDLLRLGWSVDVLAPHAPGARRREDLRGLGVRRFRYALPEAAQRLCYDGGMIVRLRERPLLRALLPGFFAAEVAAVRRLLARGYDLVHSHSLLPQGAAVDAARGLVRRPPPHVTTSHGNDVFGLASGGLYGRWKRRVLARADRVTVNSSATEAAVLELGADPARVRRVPESPNQHPVDPGLVARLRARHAPDGRALLVFAGRLIAEKGVGDAIEALGLLGEHPARPRLLVLGEGPERPAFEALVRRLELGDRVTFTGWVPGREIPSYMSLAQAFLGPSKPRDGWREAQGLTFVEAMLAGAPVVATNIGGIGDMVRHEETGLVVPPGDPAALAAAARRLLDAPDLAERLRTAARALAEERFSRAAAAGRMSAVYEELLGAPGRGEVRREPR